MNKQAEKRPPLLGNRDVPTVLDELQKLHTSPVGINSGVVAVGGGAAAGDNCPPQILACRAVEEFSSLLTENFLKKKTSTGREFSPSNSENLTGLSRTKLYRVHFKSYFFMKTDVLHE